MRWIAPLRAVAAFCMALLAATCATVEQEPEAKHSTDVVREAQAERERVLVSEAMSVTSLRLTPTADDEAPMWARAVERTPYHRMPADLAIEFLAPPGRARFGPDIERGADDVPTVSSTTNAARTLDDALREVVAAADWHLHYEDGMAVVNAQQRVEIPLRIPSGDRTGALSLDTLNERSSTGGQNAVRVDMRDAAIAELEAALGVLFGSPSGTEPRFTVSRSANIVICRGRPSEISNARDLVGAFNSRMMRRVAIDIVLYEVRGTEARDAGVDFTASYFFSDDRLTSRGAPRRTLWLRPLGEHTGSVLDPGAPNQYILETRRAGDNWSSLVNSVLHHIRDFSDVEIINRFSVEALHGQIASVEDVTTRSYIAELTYPRRSALSTTEEGPEIEVEQVREGVALSVLPTLQRDLANLQISLSLAEISALIVRQIGTNEVTLPTVSGPNHLIGVTLRSGEVRLIANLGRRKVTRSGIDAAGLMSYGKNSKNALVDVETLMLVRARILEGTP